jgi:hypothetical protein
VIGQDFLSQFDYTLDYRRSALIWERDLDDRPGLRVPLVPVAGRFAIDVRQPEAGDRPLRLVPDSGANALVLFQRPAGASAAIEAGASFELASMAGRVSAHATVVRGLEVGGVRICAQIAGVVAAPGGAEPVDGLLPLDLFSRVSFNNHRRYMLVEPREP